MKYNDPWWTCTHSIYLRGNNRLSVLVCLCVDGAIELFLQLMPSEVDYDATLRYHHMAAAEENSKKMRPRCNFGRTSPEKKTRSELRITRFQSKWELHTTLAIRETMKPVRWRSVNWNFQVFCLLQGANWAAHSPPKYSGQTTTF